MMPVSVSVSLAAALLASVAFAGRSKVDFMAWDGESDFPAGWTCSGVKKSSMTGDYKGGLWFNGVRHWLRSPRFGFAIVTVEVNLAYSVGDGKPLSRILTLRPVVGGKEADPLCFSTPGLKKNYEEQSRSLAAYGTDEFIIRLEGSGSDGNWYVGGVKVEFDEHSPVVHSDGHDADAEPASAIPNWWKLSEFGKTEDGRISREADFAFAETVRAKSAWENGVSIDSVYAFDNGRAVSNIYPATYISSPHGLYAAITNEQGRTVHALALQASRDASMEMLLPVELDVGRRVNRLSVEFRGWEPKCGAAPFTTLTFRWCAVDSLDALENAEWIGEREGDYAGSGDGSRRAIEIPGRKFGKSRFLALKWSVGKQAKSSLLGISDLRVTADVARTGLALKVR